MRVDELSVFILFGDDAMQRDAAHVSLGDGTYVPCSAMSKCVAALLTLFRTVSDTAPPPVQLQGQLGAGDGAGGGVWGGDGAWGDETVLALHLWDRAKREWSRRAFSLHDPTSVRGYVGELLRNGATYACKSDAELRAAAAAAVGAASVGGATAPSAKQPKRTPKTRHLVLFGCGERASESVAAATPDDKLRVLLEHDGGSAPLCVAFDLIQASSSTDAAVDPKIQQVGVTRVQRWLGNWKLLDSVFLQLAGRAVGLRRTTVTLLKGQGRQLELLATLPTDVVESQKNLSLQAVEYTNGFDLLTANWARGAPIIRLTPVRGGGLAFKEAVKVLGEKTMLLVDEEIEKEGHLADYALWMGARGALLMRRLGSTGGVPTTATHFSSGLTALCSLPAPHEVAKRMHLEWFRDIAKEASFADPSHRTSDVALSLVDALRAEGTLGALLSARGRQSGLVASPGGPADRDASRLITPSLLDGGGAVTLVGNEEVLDRRTRTFAMRAGYGEDTSEGTGEMLRTRTGRAVKKPVIHDDPEVSKTVRQEQLDATKHAMEATFNQFVSKVHRLIPHKTLSSTELRSCVTAAQLARASLTKHFPDEDDVEASLFYGDVRGMAAKKVDARHQSAAKLTTEGEATKRARSNSVGDGDDADGAPPAKSARKADGSSASAKPISKAGLRSKQRAAERRIAAAEALMKHASRLWGGVVTVCEAHRHNSTKHQQLYRKVVAMDDVDAFVT